MSREWIDKDCGSCEYAVDGECRLTPASRYEESHVQYLLISIDLYQFKVNNKSVFKTKYTKACAQYREIGHEDDELKY